MAFEFNPFTGTLDIVNKTTIASSDPASGYEGQFLINTTTNLLKVYYAGSWQLVATLSGGGGLNLQDETGANLLDETGADILQD